MQVTLAATTVHAMALTTTVLVGSGKALPLSILKFPNTRSLMKTLSSLADGTRTLFWLLIIYCVLNIIADFFYKVLNKFHDETSIVGPSESGKL